MPHPIDALISDCDGVPVDSEIIAERAVYEVLSTYAPLEELQRLLEDTLSLTSRDILDRVEEHLGLHIPDSFNHEMRQRSEEVVAQVRPIPGAREALLTLGPPVVVVSNSRRHNLERSLAYTGLSELIDERLASADMVALLRSTPDIYLHAANLLGAVPERCLVAEDNSIDTRTVLTARMRVIDFIGAGCTPTRHAEVLCELGAIAIIERMRELPGTMARLRCESRVALRTP